MSFLYPVFLLGALAIAVPIVLHLLRRDVAPEVPFTAVRLLRRSPIQQSKRRRLRDLLLLAARIAALLLLAAAFARPYVPSASSLGTRVIAIDRSYSMSGPGQFAKALDLARAAIDRAGSNERVAVIAFDERAQLLADPGTKADARAVLAGLAPSFGTTRYAPVVRKAVELAEGAGGTLVMIGDLQRSGWENAQPMVLPAGWTVDVQDVGGPRGNLAITALTVEPDRIAATLRNGWTSRKAGRLRVRHGDRELTTVAYDVAPATSIEVPIDMRTPVSGGIAVSLDDPDGLAADDARYRAVGSGAQPRVLIVSYGASNGFYIARALETASSEEGGVAVDRTNGPAFSKLPADKLSDTALIVLTATRGLDRRARDAVAAFTRAGGGLLITAAPDLEGPVLSTVFGWQPSLSPVGMRDVPLTFAATDLRHPIFSPFGPLLANLGQVRFTQAWRVAPEGWDIAARFSNGAPALLERIEGKGRVVLFASDLDRRWNDFPLHPAFVPFVIETTRHAAARREAAREFTVGEAPSGAEPRPGVYQLDGGRRPVTVNVDAREGDTTRLSPDEFKAMFRTAGADAAPALTLHAQEAEASQSYWRYGLLLMLAALVGESFVGRVKHG
jgi:hypothetical protein